MKPPIIMLYLTEEEWRERTSQLVELALEKGEERGAAKALRQMRQELLHDNLTPNDVREMALCRKQTVTDALKSGELPAEHFVDESVPENSPFRERWLIRRYEAEQWIRRLNARRRRSCAT